MFNRNEQTSNFKTLINQHHLKQDNIMYPIRPYIDPLKGLTCAIVFGVSGVALTLYLCLQDRYLPIHGRSSANSYRKSIYDDSLSNTLICRDACFAIPVLIVVLIALDSLQYWMRSSANKVTLPEALKNRLNELEQQFDSLPNACRERLFQKNLADKDATGFYSLKFICPISMGLIVQPHCIFVKKQNDEIQHEYYDYESIERYLLLNARSPLSQLPIIEKGFSAELNNKHLTYLLALEKELVCLANEPSFQVQSKKYL